MIKNYSDDILTSVKDKYLLLAYMDNHKTAVNAVKINFGETLKHAMFFQGNKKCVSS